MKRTGVREDGIVVAGGGLSGQRYIETLRRCGYEGPIRLVCAEPYRPYDRPPLSKQVLAGARDEQSLAYRSADWYEEHEIELLLGERAVELRPRERRLGLSSGTELPYRRLLIATGSRPRTIPWLAGYENVRTLRGLDDARELRNALAQNPRLAVVGAGFIGQEVAATARGLGCSVTLIEASPQPLASVLAPVLGEWFSWLHRSEGVAVLTGRTVESAIANGQVRALRLSDGTIIEVDQVVVGVGVAPELDWLGTSGLCTDGRLEVDPDGRTGAEDVLAVGDVAATFDPRIGRHRLGSHWEAAARQGARAARAMLGLDPGPHQPASFWTDQYGVLVQYVGHAVPSDDLEIDGEPEARSFTATFRRDGRIVAGMVVNRPRALPALREAVQKGAT